MNFYFHILRPLLFRFDPELVHNITLRHCQLANYIPGIRKVIESVLFYSDPALKNEVKGLKTANPVGLAAGFDKNGTAADFFSTLGFGFVEIGSISAFPSTGNAKPRLFRLPEDNAIVVHYGAPSEGADKIAGRLQKKNPSIPMGVNIIKTSKKKSPGGDNDTAIIGDYLYTIDKLQGVGDYLCLNLSCPNVKEGGNYFNDVNKLRLLLSAINEKNISVPLFLKVSPSGGIRTIEELLFVSDEFDFVSGFIYNLPSEKPGNLLTDEKLLKKMPGAVSGKPVEDIINYYIRETYKRMDKKRYIIIGAGGIMSAEDAYKKICLGASLVQVFTGMIYRGPGLVKEINKGLSRILQKDGIGCIAEAIGVKNK